MALLTSEQLEKIRQIIRDASIAVAISTSGMEVSDEKIKELVDQGYLDPNNIENITFDAFEFGQLMAKLPESKDMTFSQFKEYMKKNPIAKTPVEERAILTAETRAGEYCVGLGTRYSGEVTDLGVQINDQFTEAMRQGIKEKVSENILKRESVGKLRTNLRQMSEDWARDWDRIASTETHMAHQQGFFEQVVKDHGLEEKMAKMPEPTACPECIKHYTKNGKPIIMTASEWASNGSNNIGRKKADWKPVLGSMHSWCQCTLIRVPSGFAFDDNWDLVPEDMIEKSRKLHYKTTFTGLPISIENRKGSNRYWYDPHNDTKGVTKMIFPYGYIRLTEGSDGEHLDCYLGPHEESKNIYIIHQQKAPLFKEYDEDKVMLGFLSATSAKRAYLKHYNDPKFFGSMTTMSIDDFKEKIKQKKFKGKMIKSRQFHSYDGIVGISRPVGTMGNYGDPARTANENVSDQLTAQQVEDHPASKSKRKKQKRRKIRLKINTKKKLNITGSDETGGQWARNKPIISMVINRNTKRNREWIDSEINNKSERADHGKLQINPDEIR